MTTELTPDKFDIWYQAAKPLDSIVYHKGSSATECGIIARHVFQLATAGKIILLRKCVPPYKPKGINTYEYIAQKPVSSVLANRWIPEPVTDEK
jgi:hypothetical protein